MTRVKILKIDNNGHKIWTNDMFVKNDQNKKIILSKLNTSGNVLFTNQYKITTTSNFTNPSIVTDINNNIYTIYTIDKKKDLYIFIISKIDNNGSLLWSKKNDNLSTTISAIIPHFQIDNNNLYICYPTINQKNKNIYELIIAKLDFDGNVIWKINNNINYTDIQNINNSMDIDGYGNIYVAYQTKSLKEASNTISDISVFKIDNNGTIIWTVQEPTFNTKSNNMMPDITVDINGNSYIAYVTEGTLCGEYNVVNSGGKDIVLFKLDKNGNIVWRAQHPAFNTIDDDVYPAIYIDSHENLFLSYEKTGINTPTTISLVKFTTKHNCYYISDPNINTEFNMSIPKNNSLVKCTINDTLVLHKRKCNNLKLQQVFDKINKGLSFYHCEIEKIKKMNHIIEDMLHLINKMSCKNDNEIIAKLNEQANIYYNEAESRCNGLPICNDGTFNIYGTVETITGKPVSYTNGFGGIKNSKIFGDISLLLDNEKTSINMLEDYDVEYVADKFRSNVCNKISIVSGLEVCIKINCCRGKLLLTVLSKNKGNKSCKFKTKKNSDHSYKKLLKEIKEEFCTYIKYICFNNKKRLLCIIFNEGYTLQFSQKKLCPLNQYIISTSINCVPVNYGTSTELYNRYAYGYLLFYNIKNNFIVHYPPKSLPNTIVHPFKIDNNMAYYCENITLDLSKLIKCDINTVETLILKINDVCTKIDIMGFNSYKYFLKNVIKCIKPNCCVHQHQSSICTTNKINNIIKILNQYQNMLCETNKIICMYNNNLINTTNNFCCN